MAKRGIQSQPKKPTITSPQKPDTGHLPFPQTGSLRLIRPSIGLLRKHFASTVVILIVPSLLLQLGGLLTTDATTIDGPAILGAILMLVAGVWALLNVSASYYFQLWVVHDGQPSIRECYREGVKYLPRLIGLMVLSGLTVAVGLLLFIIPGLIAFRRYILAPYFLVDGDTGIREAMQRSASATKPVSGYVWSAMAVLAALAGLGWLVADYIPTYGQTIAILLTGVYAFIPALRYKEIALRRSALAIEN